MTSLSTRPEARDGNDVPVVGWAWALKRTLLGIAILSVSVGAAAWLLYATIEPETADASETPRTPAADSRMVSIDRR